MTAFTFKIFSSIKGLFEHYPLKPVLLTLVLFSGALLLSHGTAQFMASAAMLLALGFEIFKLYHIVLNDATLSHQKPARKMRIEKAQKDVIDYINLHFFKNYTSPAKNLSIIHLDDKPYITSPDDKRIQLDCTEVYNYCIYLAAKRNDLNQCDWFLLKESLKVLPPQHIAKMSAHDSIRIMSKPKKASASSKI